MISTKEDTLLEIAVNVEIYFHLMNRIINTSRKALWCWLTHENMLCQHSPDITLISFK